MKSLCESKKLKQLCVSQRQAIIKLLEKPNKDKRYVANWRPISLLNFDLKIISKSLATRLKNVLGKLIDARQTAYVNELAKLLVCSLRNIEVQVKDLFKVNEETKISQIKVTDSLDALSKKIDELETEIKNKDEKNQLLEIELKFWKKKKNLKEKKLMIWNDIPEETVCFYMVLLKRMLNVQMILLLKHVQKTLVLMLSRKTLIGAIG